MASRTSGTILFGFTSVFSCLQLLETITKIQASHSRFAWLMAVAFVSVVPIAFGLTLLLLFLYVRANAVGRDAGRRFLGRLVKATLLTATAALLAGAAVQLVASGYLGDDDIGWLHTTK